jgi:dihydrofolate reductase
LVIKNYFRKIIIAAIAKNGTIGKNGKLPWDSETELKHFKETTNGCAVLFGKNTYKSFGEPLQNRLNIVISKSLKKKVTDENLLIFKSVDKAYEYLEKIGTDKVFICGGKNIYNEALSYADEMIISWMKFEIDGDTKFPKTDFSKWDVVNRKEFNEFEVYYYKRKIKR